MEIEIRDDFDLIKIANSGQCFRVIEKSPGLFRFITGRHVVYIRKVSKLIFDVSCNRDEWEQVWSQYFDFETNYAAIRGKIRKNDTFLAKAGAAGTGIRILRQDPWETLITFIISQRRSIPSIKNCVEQLSANYGETVCTWCESLQFFPTPESINNMTVAELKECKLGYRIPYIQDAAQKVTSKEIDLLALSSLGTQELLNKLMTIYGVGPKIANCVALFAYGRKEVVPIDTWISKIIQSEYGGHNRLADYGAYSGVMQQYAFFYQTYERRQL